MAMCKAMDVAKWFIWRSAEYGDLLSNLKVQKLLYYSEAWCQVMLEKTLFEEEMQAWMHGPAVPEVFHAFKPLGRGALPVPEDDEVPEIPEDAKEVLEEVFTLYGRLPSRTLEVMTHQDDPWIIARGDLELEQRCTAVIPKDQIRVFFKTKYAE